MNIEQIKSIIEAILFAAGRVVSVNELMSALEVNSEDIIKIIDNMKVEYEKEDRGMEIIKVDEGYQMCTKPKYYQYICQVLDKRAKPNLSNAALETLSIIAYNPRITRAQIEAIRGVNTDATIYKLLEYNLIETAGKLDAPGKPTTYRTTAEFLKLFGLGTLDELPELPRYKLDENEQIVLEDLIENKENEAPMPNEEESENKEE